MKDNTTSKLVFAIALFAAVGFAVWAGFASVETQVADSNPPGAFTTPF